MCYNAFGDYMDRSNIEKIAHNPEDRMLLAKLWDKINAGIRRNIPANTCFLSPREQEILRAQLKDNAIPEKTREEQEQLGKQNRNWVFGF